MHLSSCSLAAQAVLSILFSPTSAAYTLQDDYSVSSFTSMFDFFTDADPTSGYVNYVSQSQAESEGLLSTSNDTVFIGVDSKNTASGRGRDSARLVSKTTYNHGLIVLDLEHMPGGQCGTWPAFWTLGPNWPNGGEIDIIEGANSQNTNQITAHTNAGCSITSTGAFSGTLETANCDVNAPNQVTNAGCSIETGNTQTYGSGFNAAGGGVYATEWTSSAISIWFFPRSAIPFDISSGSPSPDRWGLPLAQFAGGCDIDEHFANQQIVFDITFCGQWAGQVWSKDATCSPLAATCQDYVQNNPSAFTDTYWEVNSLKVYQENAPPRPGSSTSASTAPDATSTIATTFSTTTLPTTTPAILTITTYSSYAPPPTTTAYSALTSSLYIQSSYTNTGPTQSATWSSPPAASETQSWSSWEGGNGGSGWPQGGDSWGQRRGNSGGLRGGPPR